MKKIITGGAIALALLGGAAGPAEAAPIRECGSFSVGHGIRVFDATTRNVSCTVARIQIHRTITRLTGETGRTFWNPYMRMTCRWTRYGRSWDTRCTSGNRVIRYQHGL